jgi:lactate dehydrogenase-like 2-hydroxyacid dehydrogenase
LATYLERDEVLRQADFLTVHVFLDETTHHHISRREFELMKPTAYFINTSRGPVVDQAALIEALGSGEIVAAALDVFEKEPVAPDDPILKLPNAITTPHIASFARDTRIAMAELSARNLIAALTGQAPEAMVNPGARRLAPRPLPR